MGPIIGPGIVLRPVTRGDALFILTLRTDPNLGRFLSRTPDDLSAQQAWLDEYSKRESSGKEFYFIVEKEKTAYGAIRVYNIKGRRAEVGSWVFTEDHPKGLARHAFALATELALNLPGVDEVVLRVMKGNSSVIDHCSRFYRIGKEDDTCLYFIVDTLSFGKYRDLYAGRREGRVL